MGIGNAERNAITSAITVLGSSVTIKGYSQKTIDGGYSGTDDTLSTSVSTTAIPFEEFKKIAKKDLGDLETAGFQLALKYTETFDISGDTKYTITYQSDEYDIVSLKRYAIEDTLVAWILTLSKRFD